MEHVLLRSPETCWNLKAEKSEAKTLIGRIGNLTLLKGSVNSEPSNQSFNDKKLRYGAEENLPFISKDIPQAKSWTESETVVRQQQFRRIAVEVWKAKK